MGTDVVPASANICETVASDKEIVGDIRPLSRFDMEGLSKSHAECTLRLRGTKVCRGVTNNYVWYWQL